MAVPLFDARQQNALLRSEISEAMSRVVESGRFILGEEVEAFEKECADYIGVKHAVGVSSGTDAILAALMALDIGPGDEVICPAFTFFSTAGCVARLGATPVFADVSPESFNVTAASLRPHFTERTKAVIPVHLFGQACSMREIVALCREHEVALIEDAAQAIGATFEGQQVGGFGDLGAFSFFPTKNLGGFGDGGLVTTNDGDLAARLRRLRLHGMEPKYYHQEIGGNFRLDPLQAAVLRVKLGSLDDYTERRKTNANFYHKNLSHSATSRPPSRIQGHENSIVREEDAIILPSVHPGCTPVWNQFTIRIPGKGKRDQLREFLTGRGIGCEVYYPVPLHQQECFRGASLPGVSLPASEQVAREVLSLPIFPELTEEMRSDVVAVLHDFSAGAFS
ncbi:MAG: DegT/DnrJ/EryC1/StrS family aminotransferase [Verrucomicrobiota bacterium]